MQQRPAVQLVLVVEIGKAFGELQAPVHTALPQESGQRLESRALQQPGQELHQTPSHWQLVQHRLRGYRLAPQNLPVGTPQEAAWQFHAGGSADPVARGKLHLEPFRHAVALDEEDLLFQGLERLAANPFEDRFAQQLRTKILHDQLLELLARTPPEAALTPRDVVVMVPDIEVFAPAIRSVFGQYPRATPGSSRLTSPT
jgi:hypothetical protein